MNLDHLNEIISPNHIAALNWFHENKGSEMHLPKPIQTNDGETRLYTQAKGIYKPQGFNVSLSIKVVVDSPYPNKFIVYSDDSWLLEYHQEGENSDYFSSYIIGVDSLSTITIENSFEGSLIDLKISNGYGSGVSFDDFIIFLISIIF